MSSLAAYSDLSETDKQEITKQVSLQELIEDAESTKWEMADFLNSVGLEGLDSVSSEDLAQIKQKF